MSPYLFILVVEYLNGSLKLLRHVSAFKYHPKCTKMKLVRIFDVPCLVLKETIEGLIKWQGRVKKRVTEIILELHIVGRRQLKWRSTRKA